jgi:nucleoredoxin
MPWMALPFESREIKAALSKKYKVKGIPSLVLLDAATAATVSLDGIETVMGDPKGDKV